MRRISDRCYLFFLPSFLGVFYFVGSFVVVDIVGFCDVFVVDVRLEGAIKTVV